MTDKMTISEAKELLDEIAKQYDCKDCDSYYGDCFVRCLGIYNCGFYDEAKEVLRNTEGFEFWEE